LYAYVDRPLDTLDEGCRFLVWSMRAWVTQIGHGTCPARTLGPAFARWKLIGALQPFHRMMLVLNRDGAETLHFAPLPCPRVSEDEAVLIGLVRQIHEAGPACARDTIALIVTEDGIGDMLQAVSQLAAAMAITGVFPGASVAPGER
jgi:hypothetical protein